MFLPLIPLVLVFAAHFLPSIKIDVITANFIGFAVTFVCEFIVRKDRSRIPSDMAEIFKGMANVFVSVVAIIISASVFAEGIKILGGITIFTNMISDMKGATLLIMAILTGITYVFAIIMGSGAAPFFAFGPLTPAVAAKLGVPTLTLLLPMELATCLRSSHRDRRDCRTCPDTPCQTHRSAPFRHAHRRYDRIVHLYDVRF